MAPRRTQQVPDRLGLGPGTVKSRCSHGIAHLDALLESTDASERTEATP